MKMTLSLCFIAVFVVFFVIAVIWYLLKMRCFKYTGRTTAELTKTLKAFSNEEVNGKDGTDLIFEYEAGGEKHSFKRLRTAEMADLTTGSIVDIVYDETHPERAELASVAGDKKTAMIRWLPFPVMALVMLVMVAFCNIPEIFDFTKEQRRDFGIITQMLTPIVLGAMVIQAMKNPDSPLNRKRKHPELIGGIGLAFCALYIIFCIVLLIIL